MISKLWNHRPGRAFALGVVAAGLVACGGEFDPDAAQPGPLPASVDDLSFQNPADSTTTSITLSSSAEYDSNTNEVRIFTRVADQTGTPVASLNEFNFSLTLQPKTVGRPVSADRTSLTTTSSGDKVVALVLDSSGSMGGTTETGETRMEVAKEAARLFVDLMGAGDQTSVVDFDDSARTVQQLTADTTLLHAAIDTFADSGATNLGAAMTEAVRSVGTRPGKRAVILLTDGDDTVDSVSGGPSAWLNNTSSTRNQGLQLALANDLVIFTVGLGEDLSQNGLDDLGTIASRTGGAFFQAPTAAALVSAFTSTIPDAIDALTPTETYVLTFDSDLTAAPGQVVDIPYRLSVVYENAVGILRGKFNGTYTLR